MPSTNEKPKTGGNLTRGEMQGRTKLIKRIKEEDLVVFPTDKSGKVALMKRASYIKMASKHIANDKDVTWEEVESIEDDANRHTMAFMRIVGLGKGLGQEDRMSEALRSMKNAPPPTYFLIKDHKKRDEDGLYPTRPVCGAK